MQRDTIAIAITGASGAPYALRLLECLVTAGRPIQLMISAAAQVVMATETDLQLPTRPEAVAELLTERFAAAPGQLRVFGPRQWMAPVASGSSGPGAMVIVPCSTGTLSAVALGASDNLIERAADVVLKERRQLILVPRETPLSAIHLEHMLTLARLGAVILPAAPGFYHRPEGIGDLIDFIVARILDHLDIPHTLTARWGDGYGG